MGDAAEAAGPSPRRPLQGGCLCGAVRYEITGPFLTAGYCHCTRCQRRSGNAASANARVARTDFRLLAGEQALRAYRPEDGAPKVFCSLCGSAVFSGDLDKDAPLGLRLGGVDGDPGVRPQFHQYVQFAAAWEPIPDDGLPRYPGRRPD
jgi:hypothetical protein